MSILLFVKSGKSSGCHRRDRMVNGTIIFYVYVPGDPIIR
jgi:hypothetical protein